MSKPAVGATGRTAAARLYSAGLPGEPDLASSDAPDGLPNASSAGMVDISATDQPTFSTVIHRGCSELLVGRDLAPCSRSSGRVPANRLR